MTRKHLALTLVGMLAAGLSGCRDSTARKQANKANEASRQSTAAIAQFVNDLSSVTLQEQAKIEQIEAALEQARRRADEAANDAPGYWPVQFQAAFVQGNLADYAALRMNEALTRANIRYGSAMRAWIDMQDFYNNLLAWRATVETHENTAAELASQRRSAENDKAARSTRLAGLKTRHAEKLARMKARRDEAAASKIESQKLRAQADRTKDGMSKLAQALLREQKETKLESEASALQAEAENIASEMAAEQAVLAKLDQQVTEIDARQIQLAQVIDNARQALRRQPTTGPDSLDVVSPLIKAHELLEAELKATEEQLAAARQWLTKAQSAYEETIKQYRIALEGAESHNQQVAGELRAAGKPTDGVVDELSPLTARLALAGACTNLAQVNQMMAASAPLHDRTAALAIQGRILRQLAENSNLNQADAKALADALSQLKNQGSLDESARQSAAAGVVMPTSPAVEVGPLQERAAAVCQTARSMLKEASASPAANKPVAEPGGVNVLDWRDYIKQRQAVLDRISPSA